MKRKPSKHEGAFEGDFAERYAKHHIKMAEKFGRQFSEKLTELGFTKGRIFDSGCGFGGTDIVLAKQFPDSEIVGVDLSEPLLKIANDHAKKENLQGRVVFEKGDVQKVRFEDNYFDVVINLNMAHLVEKPFDMLNEMERVLKPDGFLFIVDLRRSWLCLLEPEIKSGFTVDEAKELIAQSKLRAGTFSKSALCWRFTTI